MPGQGSCHPEKFIQSTAATTGTMSLPTNLQVTPSPKRARQQSHDNSAWIPAHPGITHRGKNVQWKPTMKTHHSSNVKIQVSLDPTRRVTRLRHLNENKTLGSFQKKKMQFQPLNRIHKFTQKFSDGSVVCRYFQSYQWTPHATATLPQDS